MEARLVASQLAGGRHSPPSTYSHFHTMLQRWTGQVASAVHPAGCLCAGAASDLEAWHAG